MTEKRTLSLILSEMASAMDALLDFSHKKSEVLVKRDISGLEALIPAEQDLVRKLAELEGERIAAGQEDDSDIDSLKAALRDKAERLAAINTRNRGLLRRGLDLVQYELKLLFQEGKPLVFDNRA